MKSNNFLTWCVVGAIGLILWPITIPVALISGISIFINHRFWTLPKLKKLKSGSVSVVKLNRGSFSVPVRVFKSDDGWMVKSIAPELQGSNVNFVKTTQKVAEVALVDSKKSHGLVYETMRQASVPVQELYCQLAPKIVELNHKIEELKRIKQLTSSSEVYSKQSELYERAIYQFQDMVQDMRKLKTVCKKIIRETLIGSEVSKLESANFFPDTSALRFEIQEKYRIIDDQYQCLIDEIEAWSSLSKELAPSMETPLLQLSRMEPPEK